jgi:hypothetical protein
MRKVEVLTVLPLMETLAEAMWAATANIRMHRKILGRVRMTDLHDSASGNGHIEPPPF